MSGDGEPEMTGEKTHEQEVNAPSAPGATTEEFARSRKGDRTAAIHHTSEIAPWRTPTYAGCAALSMLSGRSGRVDCKKKMLKKYEQSRYVYENKQISDKMPGKKSDIYV